LCITARIVYLRDYFVVVFFFWNGDNLEFSVQRQWGLVESGWGGVGTESLIVLCLLIASKITTFLELEFNRAQTGLAIDDNVLGEGITRDFVLFTSHSTPNRTEKRGRI